MCTAPPARDRVAERELGPAVRHERASHRTAHAGNTSKFKVRFALKASGFRAVRVTNPYVEPLEVGGHLSLKFFL